MKFLSLSLSIFPSINEFLIRDVFILFDVFLGKAQRSLYYSYGHSVNVARPFCVLVKTMLTVELLIFCFRYWISFAWIVCLRSQLDRKLLRPLKRNIEYTNIKWFYLNHVIHRIRPTGVCKHTTISNAFRTTLFACYHKKKRKNEENRVHLVGCSMREKR